ncbi:N-acetyltransferase [Paracraurococcus ruber]|uniref:GNAT family N-acetyltransferase n=2 Tax=Paracraurococcus ruber TaxID=77675 RepID=A0ABS1D0I2_9PROT|nr:GNAT family N-acetyltransferase [Paracraurococcus ruber]MBK1660219.1 GNAT family N-acetyltransferase [Paracraurococcus ruber]TDG29674.1 N-acetyltransferase [Paracraurococcus ruber]
MPGRLVRTPRLTLVPPGKENLPDLIRLKGDPRVFELMLHGVRSPERTREELEDDIEFWEVRGYGTWCVFETETGEFLGIAGLMERPDGRGVAMRFALWPECRGKGYAREAARAGLEFGHRAGLARIIAVAWEENHASRQVLGDIGMAECDAFDHKGRRMILFESLRRG